MHNKLQAAETLLGIDLPCLREAADVSTLRITDAKRVVDDHLKQHFRARANRDLGLDLVAFGSLGRAESHNASDFDYLVVVNEVLPGPQHILVFREAAIEALGQLNIENPGDSKLFGGVVAAANLVT